MLIAELNLKLKHRLELCSPVTVLSWMMIKVLLNVLISTLLQFSQEIICYLYLQFLSHLKMEPKRIDDILDVNIITKAIAKLTPDEAHGPDELSSKMLSC